MNQVHGLCTECNIGSYPESAIHIWNGHFECTGHPRCQSWASNGQELNILGPVAGLPLSMYRPAAASFALKSEPYSIPPAQLPTNSVTSRGCSFCGTPDMRTEWYVFAFVHAVDVCAACKPWSCRQAQAHADMLAGKQPAAEPAVKAGNGEAGMGKGSEHAGKTLSSEGGPKRPGDETSNN